jgi:hypothetical protein
MHSRACSLISFIPNNIPRIILKSTGYSNPIILAQSLKHFILLHYRDISFVVNVLKISRNLWTEYYRSDLGKRIFSDRKYQYFRVIISNVAAQIADQIRNLKEFKTCANNISNSLNANSQKNMSKSSNIIVWLHNYSIKTMLRKYNSFW